MRAGATSWRTRRRRPSWTGRSRLTERAVARLGAAGALDEDAAYDVADAARALLGAAAAAVRGDPWEDVEAALLPRLGPPLFESRGEAGAVPPCAAGLSRVSRRDGAGRRAAKRGAAPAPPAAIWTKVPAPEAQTGSGTPPENAP